MDERFRETQLKICAYLFLGALTVRLLYLSQYATSPFFWVPALDSLYHDLLAHAIAHGHSYSVARTVQALLGAASCVLLYRIGRRLFRKSVLAWTHREIRNNLLAVCELQLGRRDVARHHLKQAVRLDPEHATARAELARLQIGG